MRLRPTKRQVPQLNTTSTADISFMLLILFLVTTSMDSDKGLTRQLPPLTPPREMPQETNMARRNVMKIVIGGDGTLSVNGETKRLSELRNHVELFVENAQDSPDLPERRPVHINLLGRCDVTTNHIIQIEADGQAPYDAYFNVQNEVVAAYNHLRDRLAMARFNHPYAQCSDRQQEALRQRYPQRVAEIYNNP